ncbi:MAG TPA: aspartate/glutamate racemase family protein [Stellaceae bacterium]|nr:aspartate/glutamate racemase family protein [Stellaceae bacterium]
MIGFRAGLGFLLPPGNPTIEHEMMAMCPAGNPAGVSLHFNRMVARGAPGSLDGQSERNASMLAHLDESIAMLALVNPDIIVIAHTATSYDLGRDEEARLLDRLAEASGTKVTTAFASVAAALERLGVKRVALGAPYSPATTDKGRAHLEAHGFSVVHHDNLKGVVNIYDTTAEQAYRLARAVDRPEAEAVFLSGTGMPTVSVIDMLETDLQKPVISSNSAMLWLALRACGVNRPVPGFGRLLTLD